ncbi:hypothetical protein [Candidatus Nitrospira bockiana]
MVDEGIEDKGDLNCLVGTPEEYDQFIASRLPELLDHAVLRIRRFMRETGQWADDCYHEKLALRWAFELVQRFVPAARLELPCRPLLLLESNLARFLSQADAFCCHKDLTSPLGRFLEALTARAVISRDALVALFHHLYGYSPRQVVRLLQLGVNDLQRIYKNFERWRRSGWSRMLEESGLTQDDLQQLEQTLLKDRCGLDNEARRLLAIVQPHYRKSEPDHYECRTRAQWAELFEQDYGIDYRIWHLALCTECTELVYDLRRRSLGGMSPPRVAVRLRPLAREGLFNLGLKSRTSHGTDEQSCRLSAIPDSATRR